MNPWKTRCWLLTSPRSGSTYLQFLLNHNAGVSGSLPDDREMARFSFGEHMSQKFCHSLNDFLVWDPIVSKVHCHHFGAYLMDRPLLKKQISPSTRFVLLERRDTVAQAVSLALANQTGITQCNTVESQVALHSKTIELTDQELLDCLSAIRDYQQFWRNWLHSEPHLVVTYESLIETPRETVSQIFDFLKTPCPVVSLDVPLRKLDHPQTPEYIELLRELSISPDGSRTCPAT